MSVLTLSAEPVSPEKLLGLKPVDPIRLSINVEKGLKFDALVRLSSTTGLSVEKLRPALRITPRTLTRRKAENRLSAEESDRLMSVSRVLSKAIDLFSGRTENAMAWMMRPNLAFGDITPLEMASTEVGCREVENLIGRLEHGVFT